MNPSTTNHQRDDRPHETPTRRGCRCCLSPPALLMILSIVAILLGLITARSFAFEDTNRWNHREGECGMEMGMTSLHKVDVVVITPF